jgi:hypothetical protein
MTLSAHIGCFKLHSLLHNITSPLAIFQQIIPKIVENIPGLFVYLDDILISDKFEQECYERLLHVLKRFSDHVVRVN